MVQRLAILIGGLGAAGVIALAIALNSFASVGSSDANVADAQAALPNVPAVAAANNARSDGSNTKQGTQTTTKTKKVVDKVYIAPTPAPKTIKVAPKSTPAPAQAKTTQPKAPAAAPATNYDASYDDGHEGRQSERSGNHGHERGDD